MDSHRPRRQTNTPHPGQNPRENPKMTGRTLTAAAVLLCLAAPLHQAENKPSPEAVRQAAAAGDAGAQTTLGQMYYHGIGAPQSNRQAATWLQKAAMQGHAPAQLDLGILFRDLTEPPAAPGPPPAHDAFSRIKAYVWMSLAAESAQRRPQSRQYPLTTYTCARDDLAAKMQPFEIPAARSLAAVFRSRIEDTPRPPGLSFQYLERAAREGEPTAAARLAHCYAYGRGTPPNLIKAYTWTLVSILRGGQRPGAGEFLQWLARQMTRSDIILARGLVHQAAGDTLLRSTRRPTLAQDLDHLAERIQAPKAAETRPTKETTP